MCRLVLFAGTCTICNESLTWADLSQELSCLAAKNADAFGSCRRGVDVETHSFDQECDACAGEDEGVGGMDFGEELYHRLLFEQHQRYHGYAQEQLQMQRGHIQVVSSNVPPPTPPTPPTAPSSTKRNIGTDDGDGRRNKRART
ncbi:hypothetical protein CTRI78_v009694 [Colletotrichum trifolii]|uniref:Uncharacterized protein n=1 Tax=Colletotrichum trifolii TaxID=5466 RepID=A0A4R8QQ20_COLTR|nr:hypothetical protein CTRI78_v009694 [Colletotrichum trifolii]